MVNESQSSCTRKNETSKPISPDKTSDRGREEETHADDQVDIPPVLPPHNCALAQVGNISNTGLSSGLEDHPSNV